MFPQLAEAQRSRGLTLPSKHEGDFIFWSFAQQVFREIQARVGKPAATGHFVAIDEYASALVADHLAKVPELRPKISAIFDTPAMQRVIIESFAISLRLCSETCEL